MLDLTRALAARGHNAYLCSPEFARDGVTDRTLEFEPRLIKVERSFGPWLTRHGMRQLRQALTNADVVHLHQLWDPACAQVAWLAKRMNVPFIVTLHGVLDRWSMAQKPFKKRVYLSLVARHVLESATIIHCTAEAEKSQATRWFQSPNVVVLPYLTDLAAYRDLPGPQLAEERYPEIFATPHGKVALFLSRLHPKKGLENLLRAIAISRKNGHAISLAIAGSCEEPYQLQLTRLARQLGIDKCVYFLGFVCGKEKLSLYQAADVLVLPTYQENWGLVLTESLACGTPVITTKGTDIWRELESSNAAVITKIDPESIGSDLTQLLYDSSKLKKMGQKGRRWVFTEFDVNRIASAYERLYKSVPTFPVDFRSAA